MARGDSNPAVEVPRHKLVLPGTGGEMWFRHLPAGEFIMGSRYGDEDEGEYWIAARQPEHRVVIATPFWMAETPVTQAQFAAWTWSKAYAGWREAREQGAKHENGFKDRASCPAESMTWDEADAYCTWLTGLAGASLPAGHRASLPNEAQWEYASRGKAEVADDLCRRTEYHTGDGESRLAEAGWFGEEWGKGGTHDVGARAPNGFGLCDMHGNVLEWCADVWDPRAYRKREDGWEARAWTLDDAGADARFEGGPRNPGVAPVRSVRGVRGGSWRVTARVCRSAFRYRWGPVCRYWYLGFRVCLVRGPAEPTQPLSERRAERSRGSTRPRSAAEGSPG